MKKMFFSSLGLLFFACKKEATNPAPDFSVLTKFNWQNIRMYEERFVLDTTQVIRYADTSLYSFGNQNFRHTSQITVIQQVFGRSQPSFQLHKIASTIEGQYAVSSKDSLLLLSYQTKIAGNPGWGVPVRDTLIHLRYKILYLDQNTVKLQAAANNLPTIPFPPFITTYNAVPK